MITGSVLEQHFKCRPVDLEFLRLGQWFCNAYNITNFELFYATNYYWTRDYIVSQYGTYDPTFMSRYNEANGQVKTGHIVHGVQHEYGCGCCGCGSEAERTRGGAGIVS